MLGAHGGRVAQNRWQHQAQEDELVRAEAKHEAVPQHIGRRPGRYHDRAVAGLGGVGGVAGDARREGGVGDLVAVLAGVLVELAGWHSAVALVGQLGSRERRDDGLVVGHQAGFAVRPALAAVRAGVAARPGPELATLNVISATPVSAEAKVSSRSITIAAARPARCSSWMKFLLGSKSSNHC